MSASEKLAALDEMMTRAHPEKWDWLYLNFAKTEDGGKSWQITTTPISDESLSFVHLRNALPQIVAVMSATEAITLRPDVNNMPPRDCGYVRFAEIHILRAALTALDEALS